MMKVFSKRGAAVLDAPEDTFAPSADQWMGRGPAPAGALHRSYAGLADEAEISASRGISDELDDNYKPRLSSFRVRLRGGMPVSTAGRVTAGALALLPLLVAGIAVFSARSYLLHDERFVVAASSQIQTSGNVHLTRAQLLSVFGEDVQRNVFKVPLETRRADLERLPWVQHATVERLLPNRIRVAITERTPVAFVRQGTHIGLVDASGVLLDMPEESAGDPHYSFPVLTGLAQEDALSTRAARMEIYRRFIKELDGGGAVNTGGRISDQLSEVDVSNPEDVKALIPSGGTDILVHFGDEDFLARYHQFEEHLAEWRSMYPKLASADMRYPQQVLLEMQPGAGVPLGTTAATASESATGDVSVSKPVDVKPAPKAVAKPVPAKAAAGNAETARKAKIAAELAAARKGRTKVGGAQ